MLNTLFVFGDGFHGASLFTRHGDVDDGMIGATFMADATAYAFIVIDFCFARI